MAENKIFVECDCGCGIMEFEKEDFGNGPELLVSYYGSTFYEKQNGPIGNIWRRIKFAFYILAGKEFRLYDVILDKNHADEFVGSINRIWNS